MPHSRPGRSERSEPKLRRHRALVALCVLVPMAEATVVAALGPLSAGPITPQSTAPVPFGVFHDLRWVLVYHSSWLSFGLEMAALWGLRSALTAATVRLAWPQDADPPHWPHLLRLGAASTLATGLLLFPFAALLFGMAVVPVSYLFFGALPVVLVIALLLPHGGATSWWRRSPPLRTVGWAALAFVVLTLSGGLIAAAPFWLAPVIAALTGLFNAWAWLGVVRAVVLRESRRRRVRFVPLAPAGLAALVGVVVLGVTVTVGLHHSTRGTVAPRADRTGKPVLVMEGFGSSWKGGAARLHLPPGFDVRTFSYAGLDADGDPKPYVGADTHRDVPELVGMLARQVDQLHRESGLPVSLVGESEGALVSRVYLAAHPHAPVSHLVLLSPLVEPGRVFFPGPGDEGWGVAAGWTLRAVADALHSITPLHLQVDGPLVRSIDDHAPTLRSLLGCAEPGVQQLALFPLADAVGAPYDTGPTVPAAVVPALHGRLLDDRQAATDTANFLNNGAVPGFGIGAISERLVRAAASPWQVPTLHQTLEPAWSGGSTGASCSTARQQARSWVLTTAAGPAR